MRRTSRAAARMRSSVSTAFLVQGPEILVEAALPHRARGLLGAIEQLRPPLRLQSFVEVTRRVLRHMLADLCYLQKFLLAIRPRLDLRHGAEAAHPLTFKSDHPMRADHIVPPTGSRASSKCSKITGPEPLLRNTASAERQGHGVWDLVIKGN